jgi:hypothetical protein
MRQHGQAHMTMHGFFARAVTALALLLTVAAPRAVAQETELVPGTPVTISLEKAQRVEVFAGSGYVLLKKATGPDVVVSVAKAKLAAEARVVMLQGAEGLTICTVYPSDDPKKPHACVPGGKGRIYQGNPTKLPDIGVTVELPDGIDASASIGAGEVRSLSVVGTVVLYSDRGTITVMDGGTGDIGASVGLLGNIQAGLVANGTRARKVDLHSPGSGRVRVVMPRGLSVSYSISTQVAPRMDPAFGITPKTGLMAGSTSPLASEVRLTVETGIAGQFVLQQSAAR